VDANVITIRGPHVGLIHQLGARSTAGRPMDRIERYLSRVHLIHWLIGGAVTMIPSGIIGYLANLSGWNQIVVFFAMIGCFCICLIALALVLTLYQLLRGHRLVPLRDALRMAYEQCEASVGQGNFSAGFHGNIEAELSPYLEALGLRHTRFFAKRPRSGRRLQIDSARRQFALIPGTSDLAAADAPRTAIYENVAIRASEIQAAIKHWRENGFDSRLN
jgi:hypothetical protein